MNAQNFRTASWFDAASYPFPSKFQTVSGHRMHYIDVGSGPLILFVHGTPTWSYLYRQQIVALSREFRCVAIDHIGFGMSDKPKDAPYSPEWHSRSLEQFVDALGLQDFTLVVHDFGGPIGLSMAIRRPEIVKRVVLMNTFLWETANNPAAQKVDRLIRSALGRFLYLRMNASPKFLLKSAFADKRKLTKALHRHYTKVFPNRESRWPAAIGQGILLRRKVRRR
ncbi:MAG: alpha/beta fold hydrolase [Bacteroidia bacterium]